VLTLTISHSPPLEKHLSEFEVDGATVASVLFADGRLMYPGRHDVEQTMQAADPYTLWHEARVVGGLFGSISKAVWDLALAAGELPDLDPTLDLLWRSHAAAQALLSSGPSLDRLVAALVMVESLRRSGRGPRALDDSAIVLVRAMAAAGFPASATSLEEIWDGAAPACVGLGLVEIG
jgi:hypothetical protein